MIVLPIEGVKRSFYMSSMTDTKKQIAERLESAFAERGFAEPGVAELRDRAGVSIRTLYKYFPSRDDMILAALEYRHERYIDFLFPEGGTLSLGETLARVGEWMKVKSSDGCLFHDAVAAHPENQELRRFLARHKEEVSGRLAECAGIAELKTILHLIHEGLVQTWPLEGEAAVKAARELADNAISQRTR